MTQKKIRAVGLGLLAALWLALTAFSWFGERTEYSDTERRLLAQAPEVKPETVINGTFMQDFESFSLDYYKGSIEEMSTMRKNFKDLYDYAHGFSLNENENAPASLLLLGATGLGKTHLSTAVARVVIERGYDVFYNSAVGMLSDFEYRRFGNGLAEENDDTARYTEADLLIIDDLGTEVVNQFTLSCLYYVINTRLNLQKPTIINTNLMPAELRKTYTDRISSRLMGEFEVVRFCGVDVRRQKLEKK